MHWNEHTYDIYSKEYYDWIQEHLYSAVVADILDMLGWMDQVMSPEIHPLYTGASIVGRAATMLAVETYLVPEREYDMQLELLDSVRPGEVVVCAMVGKRSAAMWGELISTHCKAHGVRGAVIGGQSRDIRGITALQFPVFGTGLVPADSKGRYNVVETRTKIQVGGVIVNDGDLLVADADGCVVVPRTIEEEVICKASEKVSGENKVREILAKGVSIRKVFEEYGIL